MKNPSSVVVIGLQILGLAGCSRQSWPSSANNLNWVQTISITRNANDLYAGCLDGTIRIWDFGRSNLRVWSASVKPIDSIDLSQDEKHLASGGMEPIVKLWDAKTGQLTHSFLGHKRWVKCVRFSPTNNLLASGSFDGSVKIWNLADRSLMTSLEGNADEIWSVAFSPDGLTLVSGHQNGTIILWKNAFTTHRVVKVTSASIRAMAFFDDGRIMAISSADGVVRLLDIYSQGNRDS